MKIARFVVSFTLILLLAFPCTASADSAMDEYTQLIENCLAEGMTIEEIAVSSHQSSVDVLSNYSDNYLKVLIAVMQIELRNRGFSQGEVVVPMGEYIVGEDIPAGAYSITLAEIDSVPMSIITIRSESGKVEGHYYLMKETDIVGKVTLKEGQTVEISSDSVTFAPYIGLGF